MTSQCNYYEILGVSPDADISELRKAFRSLSKEFHPDTTKIPNEVALERFQLIAEAYNLLSDPVLRANYDLFILRELKKQSIQNELSVKPYESNGRLLGVRRALSGGELFSLALLAIAFFICIVFGVGFALIQGRELFVIPNWILT